MQDTLLLGRLPDGLDGRATAEFVGDADRDFHPGLKPARHFDQIVDGRAVDPRAGGQTRAIAGQVAVGMNR